MKRIYLLENINLEDRLNDEGLELLDEFNLQFSDSGCSCFQCPPCSWCTHPGNPHNLIEDDSLMKTEMTLFEAVNEPTFKYGIGYFYDYRLYNDMVEWLTQQFGECANSRNFNTNMRWFRSSSHFFFTTQQDRTWFILKWSNLN
jgi:hypothetical protein